MEFTENNISTIAVLIYNIIAPTLVAYGVDIDQQLFVSAIVIIVDIILIVWSARNPNTFAVLGNSPVEVGEEDGC